jgi:hypothetical protein
MEGKKKDLPRVNLHIFRTGKTAARLGGRLSLFGISLAVSRANILVARTHQNTHCKYNC